MNKKLTILAVVVTWLLLSVLLISQADADTGSTWDKRVTAKLKGGEVTTKVQAIWEITKYKETQLPKKYPFKYAPWESYLAIDQYVTIESRRKCNALVIDEALYKEILPKATRNKARAKQILKQYKVTGKTRADYLKIRKYVRSGADISGVKSAWGFFENHGGDCAAYTSAVYVLCKTQGIPVRWCMGSCDGYLHAWNRVKLGGKWYWADETIEEPLSKKLWYGYGLMVMW